MSDPNTDFKLGLLVAHMRVPGSSGSVEVLLQKRKGEAKLSIGAGDLLIIEAERNAASAMAKSALIGRLAMLHPRGSERSDIDYWFTCPRYGEIKLSPQTGSYADNQWLRHARLLNIGYAGPYSSLISFLSIFEQVKRASRAGGRECPDADLTVLLERLQITGAYHHLLPQELLQLKELTWAERRQLRQLALIARAMAAQPRLIILDEPYTGIEKPIWERIWKEILAPPERTVVIGHIAGAAQLSCDKPWRLHVYRSKSGEPSGVLRRIQFVRSSA